MHNLIVRDFTSTLGVKFPSANSEIELTMTFDLHAGLVRILSLSEEVIAHELIKTAYPAHGFVDQIQAQLSINDAAKVPVGILERKSKAEDSPPIKLGNFQNLSIPECCQLASYRKDLLTLSSKGCKWVLKSIASEIRHAKESAGFEKKDARIMEFLVNEFSDEWKQLAFAVKVREKNGTEIVSNWMTYFSSIEHQETLIQKDDTEIWSSVIQTIVKQNRLALSDVALDFAARCLRRMYSQAIRETFRKHSSLYTFKQMEMSLFGQLTEFLTYSISNKALHSLLDEPNLVQLQNYCRHLISRYVSSKNEEEPEVMVFLRETLTELDMQVNEQFRIVRIRRISDETGTDSSLINMLENSSQNYPAHIDDEDLDFDSDVRLVNFQDLLPADDDDFELKQK
jgi:hypothetical protein